MRRYISLTLQIQLRPLRYTNPGKGGEGFRWGQAANMLLADNIDNRENGFVKSSLIIDDYATFYIPLCRCRYLIVSLIELGSCTISSLIFLIRLGHFPT